jgi:hypothetical protein
MQLKETKIKWWMRKDGTGRRRTAKKLLYPEINGAITGILLESKKKRACGNYNLRSFRFPPNGRLGLQQEVTLPMFCR